MACSPCLFCHPSSATNQTLSNDSPSLYCGRCCWSHSSMAHSLSAHCPDSLLGTDCSDRVPVRYCASHLLVGDPDVGRPLACRHPGARRGLESLVGVVRLWYAFLAFQLSRLHRRSS